MAQQKADLLFVITLKEQATMEEDLLLVLIV
jgi:hypothetical protein